MLPPSMPSPYAVPHTIACVLLAALVAPPAAAQILQPGFDQAFLVSTGDSRAYGVAIEDFTSDGTPDLVASGTPGDVRLFVGNGDGSFGPGTVVINAAFTDAFGLTVADFDRDGFQDIALGRSSSAGDGQVELYLGNGDGSFESTGFPQLGLFVGDAGDEAAVLAAADVDGDGDPDLVAGDVSTGANDTADVVLFRNQLEVQGGALAFVAETLLAGVDRGFSPLPEEPPYFPPDAGFAWEAYGLALGDVDADGDPDLLVADQAHYLYVYENDGTGRFAPVRYEAIGGRPFAFARMDASFASAQAALAVGDLNGDGALDLVVSYQGSSTGSGPGEVHLWLNEGTDAMDRATFTNGGPIGGAGNDARGLAVGQLDPDVDLLPDVAFGNFQGEVHGLFADITDTDGDGVIDDLDNAPLVFNPPIVDMNTDGGINRFDQLDADFDGAGDPVDADDDDDGVPDAADSCPLSPDPAQGDQDGDGVGDACDPLNDGDFDADGILDGPTDPALLAQAVEAKGRWARSDTHIVIRVDALGRAFQNEFTQTLVDGATLTGEAWDLKKFDNYNGIGDAPALPEYQVPEDLPGGADLPLTLVVIPKQIWNAFGDPDPIGWINDRNANPNLEIAQHGAYHTNNTPLGDWRDLSDRNFFSCETCGLDFRTAFQLMRVGRRTLLGEYDDPWILQSGADPETSPRIDWSDAAKPLIGFAPPYNTSDTEAREAVAHLGFRSFSASVFEEQSPIFTPEGSHQNDFDPFGMFHASAVAEVGPEGVDALEDIVTPGELNTILIEEVSWATRYCNALPRLASCPEAPGGVNRENNMVDPERWAAWLELLAFARAHGEVMTMSDYALAIATDNCPGVPNPGQADADADGTGDVCDVDDDDLLLLQGAINPGSRGRLPVAILGSPSLDLSRIRLDTLAFGPDGAPLLRATFEDVNGDGREDLLLFFSVPETGLAAGDAMACLSGVYALTGFEACSPIQTVP